MLDYKERITLFNNNDKENKGIVNYIDLDKTIEQQPFVISQIPNDKHRSMCKSLHDIIQKQLKLSLDDKLESEIKSGKVIWIKDRFIHNDIIKNSDPLSSDSNINYALEMGSPFYNVTLWKNNCDFKILYRLLFKAEKKSYATFRTQILTSDISVIKRLENTLSDWIFEPSVLEHRETSISSDRDVSNHPIRDILAEMTNDIYNVVAGCSFA